MKYNYLKDKSVLNLISQEDERQAHELEMIASENYVSQAVIEAYANVFTNKYSEGYVGKRYYGGNQIVDSLELLTQYRGLRIFGLIENNDTIAESGNFDKLGELLNNNKWGINVQPLSGAPANLAVYIGLLNPGDTILGMSLDQGGHLSHGHPLNTSGLYYNIVPYGLKKQDLTIDYDEIMHKAIEFKPKIILAGFSCYPRSLEWKEFSKIADKVQAIHGYRPILMADIAHIAGLIAGEAIEGPFNDFDVVTTTTHKTLRGPRGGVIYYKNQDIEKNGKIERMETLINRGLFPGVQGGPHDHVCAAKCVAFGEILQTDFKSYAVSVIKNAQALSEELINLGWNVITGGTENHIVWMDCTHHNGMKIEVTGKIAEKALENVGISINKNMIPFDPRKPLDPSGIRIGTPAVTTRGLGVEEMKEIASIINEALLNYKDEEKLLDLKKKINSICQKFPLYY